MKKVLIASVVTVGMALPAAAADMATKAPIYKAPSAVAAYDWSGFYIGANGGFAWSEKCWFSVNQAMDEGCHNPSGGVAGGQLGYNWQFGNFVVGVEGTGDWSDFTAGRPSVLNPAVTLNSNVNGIFTAAARVGGAWNNWLFYGKGGAAWVRDKYNEVFLGQVATVGSETRSGWLAGVGTEFRRADQTKPPDGYGSSQLSLGRSGRCEILIFVVLRHLKGPGIVRGFFEAPPKRKTRRA